jgi:CRISPR-associated exonuclease Cas4
LETYIPISFLNDFLFCPRSIYFHQLYSKFSSSVYEQVPQKRGKAAHEAIDLKRYSTRRNILQGLEVYSEKYALFGKIDTFDVVTGRLRERKREIKTIYEGFVLQIYGQCLSLREMGYTVTDLSLYDLTHNKEHPLPLPEDAPDMMARFDEVVQALKEFNLEDATFKPIEAKCRNCIYNNLCDHSLC